MRVLVACEESKREWVNRVPDCLPQKTRAGETFIWIDVNGEVFELGRDFKTAEEKGSYPCKVYRLVNVQPLKQ